MSKSRKSCRSKSQSNESGETIGNTRKVNQTVPPIPKQKVGKVENVNQKKVGTQYPTAHKDVPFVTALVLSNKQYPIEAAPSTSAPERAKVTSSVVRDQSMHSTRNQDEITHPRPEIPPGTRASSAQWAEEDGGRCRCGLLASIDQWIGDCCCGGGGRRGGLPPVLVPVTPARPLLPPPRCGTH